ncbi:MAG: prolipoprotein diacylglyceryl transferase [bacterium]
MFLHNFQPQSIIFSLGPLNFYWYGFFISLGITAGLIVGLKLAKRYQIASDLIWELLFWLLPSGFIGARLYHVLISWQYYLAKPLEIFKFWHGGLAIHGAVFGSLLALIVFAKKNKPPHQKFWCGGKLSFWQLVDILAPALALGQAIGRWGNYFNQELFGRPTNLPWGIPIELANRPLDYLNFSYFHPTFLYESLLNFLIFLILLKIHSLKLKGKLKIPTGNIFLIYLILYSTVRFFLEFVRIDENYLLFGLRWAQIVSLLIIIISFLLLSFLRKQESRIKN